MGSRIFPAAHLFCPALLNTAEFRSHVTIFRYLRRHKIPKDPATRGQTVSRPQAYHVYFLNIYEWRGKFEDRMMAKTDSGNKVRMWKEGESAACVFPNGLSKPCCMRRSQICFLLFQSMQHYSSSASEPVTMFSHPAVPKTAGQIALSCSGPCATAAHPQSCRSHRRQAHSAPPCSPAAYPAPQRSGQPSCAAPLRRHAPYCGRS